MRVLLRVIAIWTALQGALVLLFGLSHWRLIRPPGGAISVSAALLVAVLILAGLFAGWASVELWGLRRKGRLGVAAFYLVTGVVFVLGTVSSGRLAPAVIPLLLTATILAVLFSGAAARAAQGTA